MTTAIGQPVLTPKRVKELVGECPPIAYPTLVLTLCCISIELYVGQLLLSGTIAPVTATIINTIVIFAVFTPMHDASHGSIATVKSGHRYLNDLIGVLSGLCFPIPYYAFKFLHLLHHKYTNDPINDPDSFAGVGPVYVLPIRWMLMELKQYTNYFPRILQRPPLERYITLATIVGYLMVIFTAYRAGLGTEILYGWILPGRIAVTLLAFAFDYLPHRPHDVPRSVSDYQATCVLSVVGDWTTPLTIPLLYQNYHNIHHLAPYVPFYYYASIWHATKNELLQNGTTIKPIFFGKDSVVETMFMAAAPRVSAEKKMW